MRFSRIRLTNWKNFTSVDVNLPERAFLIGPNASGKSNFLDAFRFLRDLAAPGGGLQRACELRGGVSKIRCLSARPPAGVGIFVELTDDKDIWTYEIVFKQQTQFPTKIPIVDKEIVTHNGKAVLSRPDTKDKADDRQLSQTALEQIFANQQFRPIVDHLADISYLHLIPQMVREANSAFRDQNLPDVYGGQFLERISRTPEKTRNARLKRIEDALKIAVPQLKQLSLKPDERGVPHLEAIYEHWRPKAGRQDESQFSDGTLRLIGLLWVLQEGSGLLLMEEPELSLHKGIVTRLAAFIYRLQTRKKIPRQVFISTHSVDLLSDPGIDASEILVFKPSKNGTTVQPGEEIEVIKYLMETGLPASEAAIPYTEEPELVQMEFFDLT